MYVLKITNRFGDVILENFVIDDKETLDNILKAAKMMQHVVEISWP